MVCFLIPCQIVSIVSSDPVCARIASLVSSMFRSVIAQGMYFCCSRIPLYAMAWVSVASFAPWRSNSIGMSRCSSFGVFLVVPVFASLSLLSLPCVPRWPSTHLR